MHDCRFCMGEQINAHSVGHGIRTMHEMLSMLTGDEPTELSNGIILVDGNKMNVDNSAGEYAPVQIEINYCPMCGRKLERND